jgi:hypothetical protein
MPAAHRAIRELRSRTRRTPFAHASLALGTLRHSAATPRTLLRSKKLSETMHVRVPMRTYFQAMPPPILTVRLKRDYNTGYIQVNQIFYQIAQNTTV